MQKAALQSLKPGTAFIDATDGRTYRVAAPVPKSHFTNRMLPAPDRGVMWGVDENFGLKAFMGSLEFDVPSQTVTPSVSCPDLYLITATFERSKSDDLPVLESNFAAGKISVDPDKDFSRAAREQLAMELQPIFEQGADGRFMLHQVIDGRCLDLSEIETNV